MTAKYKNLTITASGIIVAYILSHSPIFQKIVEVVSSLGPLSMLIAGALFVSTFTVATGAILLFELASQHSLIELVLVSGLGAVLGDLIIFQFVRNSLKSEITYLFYHKLKGQEIRKLFHTKYFNWSLPVLGALIIASPLPDEIGVSLLGISRMRTITFIFVSYALNCLGILFLVGITKLV